MFVQAVARIPSDVALHGTYVEIHTSVGTMTLDADIMTFSSASVGKVSQLAFTAVTSQSAHVRRLPRSASRSPGL